MMISCVRDARVDAIKIMFHLSARFAVENIYFTMPSDVQTTPERQNEYFSSPPATDDVNELSHSLSECVNCLLAMMALFKLSKSKSSMRQLMAEYSPLIDRENEKHFLSCVRGDGELALAAKIDSFSSFSHPHSFFYATHRHPQQQAYVSFSLMKTRSHNHRVNN